MTQLSGKNVRNLSTVSTIVDAALAFARGRPKAGALLLGAAALSTRVPGAGVVVSVLLRIYQRVKR